MKKILSVVIPSYNMEAYLEKCLSSCLSCGETLLSILDVIVINDGSKDKTRKIAEGWVRRYPDVVRVINKPNGHYGSCVNAGLREAKGLYVKTLDADDIYDKGEFAKYLRKLNDLTCAGRVYDLILNDFVIVDAEDVVQATFDYGYVEKDGFGLDDFTFTDDRRVITHAVAYRTDMLRAMGYAQSEGIPYTDQEWIVKPVSHVRSFCHVKACVYRYFIGREGQTVEQRAYVRGVTVQIRIFKGLILWAKQNDAGFSAAYQKYFENNLRKRIALIYRLASFADRRDVDPKILMGFDEFLRDERPDLYNMVSQLSESRRLRFHYVREWRRGYTNRTVRFFLFKVYGKVMSWANQMRG